MKIVVLSNLPIKNPARFKNPAEPYSDERWGYLYLTPIKVTKKGGTVYALRVITPPTDPDFETFANLRFGYKGHEAGLGREAFHPGDCIVVASGPHGQTPACTVYSVVE